ncbi:hypothetical protein H2248_012142 [Termitomyces sp. 'cryptogamus']|nr:hypothetical protein H2248_012142 [Termitomyces sp. 'cryptogamus']
MQFLCILRLRKRKSSNAVKLASTQLVAREDDTVLKINKHTSTQEDVIVSTVAKRTSTPEDGTSTIDRRTCTQTAHLSSPEPRSPYDTTYEPGFDDDDEDTDSPSPFISVYESRHDTTVRIVAVRNVDNGRAPLRGCAMCIKIVPKSMVDIIAQELRTYNALCRSFVDSWVLYAPGSFPPVAWPFALHYDELSRHLLGKTHLYQELMDCDLLDVLHY